MTDEDPDYTPVAFKEADKTAPAKPSTAGTPRGHLTAKQYYKALKAEEKGRQKRYPGDTPPDTVAILGRDGRVHTPKTHGVFAPGPNGGQHVREASTRFWLPRRIPAGWITVYVEGDPEAVTTRQPLGFNTVDVEKLTGKYVLHLVGGGLKARLKVGGGLMVPIIIGVLFTIGIAAVGYWIYKARYAQ